MWGFLFGCARQGEALAERQGYRGDRKWPEATSSGGSRRYSAGLSNTLLPLGAEPDVSPDKGRDWRTCLSNNSLLHYNEQVTNG